VETIPGTASKGDDSMRMLKDVVILSLLAMVALCVLNVAAASSMSASQMRSSSSTYHINIMWYEIGQKKYPWPQNSRPVQTTIKQNFHIWGNVTKDGKLIEGDGIYVFHGEVISNVPNPTQWTVDIKKNGTFDDEFQFADSGRHDLIYTYFWGNGPADFCQSDVVSVYAIQNA